MTPDREDASSYWSGAPEAIGSSMGRGGRAMADGTGADRMRSHPLRRHNQKLRGLSLNCAVCPCSPRSDPFAPPVGRWQRPKGHSQYAGMPYRQTRIKIVGVRVAFVDRDANGGDAGRAVKPLQAQTGRPALTHDQPVSSTACVRAAAPHAHAVP